MPGIQSLFTRAGDKGKSGGEPANPKPARGNPMPNPPALSRLAIREIAHELRSPLGGFEAMLELLAATPLTPEQGRLVEALEQSAQHLRAVLARVLPPHAGRARKPLRLGALLRAIAASAEARASQKYLAFALKIDPALESTSEIDALALRQVLENLIDNAIRATETGGVTLDVRRSEPARIAFSLTDSGTGLDAEHARNLMAGLPTSAKSRGLGLGIAARLVARAGGQLAAEVGPDGAGTTFTFDWPDGPAENGYRLLIVDDQPAARLVLRTVLMALGFACEEASGPADALARLEGQRFDAIFTDLHMPEGGGRRLMEALASMPHRPAIIIVSAEEMSEEALPGHCDAVIAKPLTVQAVVDVIRKLGLSPREIAAA